MVRPTRVLTTVSVVVHPEFRGQGGCPAQALQPINSRTFRGAVGIGVGSEFPLKSPQVPEPSADDKGDALRTKANIMNSKLLLLTACLLAFSGHAPAHSTGCRVATVPTRVLGDNEFGSNSGYNPYNSMKGWCFNTDAIVFGNPGDPWTLLSNDRTPAAQLRHIPEPSTLALCALTGMLLFHRRK